MPLLRLLAAHVLPARAEDEDVAAALSAAAEAEGMPPVPAQEEATAAAAAAQSAAPLILAMSPAPAAAVTAPAFLRSGAALVRDRRHAAAGTHRQVGRSAAGEPPRTGTDRRD